MIDIKTGHLWQSLIDIILIYTLLGVALAPPPLPQAARIQQQENKPEALVQFAERPPDFGEYVDFGAQTGDNGAFGWYADYPLNNHESYRH